MKFTVAALLLTASAATVLAASKDLASMSECMSKDSCISDPAGCAVSCMGVTMEEAKSMLKCQEGCTMPSELTTSNIEVYSSCMTGCITKYAPQMNDVLDDAMSSIGEVVASITSDVNAQIKTATKSAVGAKETGASSEVDDDSTDNASGASTFVGSSAVVAMAGALALYQL
ncbi:hypothetical protein IWQ60_008564 [Tieghemiomyces parasiticus]|uniref:Uncharacterized protein n=1 Tax=Tieghemiomyces parasiticus TaxID=78921 RepID=A0A9W7ZX64_9FUNG|nr:hypothetical protein IWQ60_008564 [Tieghemiomyces parasiticus]